MAGHSADSVTWFNGEHLVTSTAYGDSPRPELEAYAKSHPIKSEFGEVPSEFHMTEARFRSDPSVFQGT